MLLKIFFLFCSSMIITNAQKHGFQLESNFTLGFFPYKLNCMSTTSSTKQTPCNSYCTIEKASKSLTSKSQERDIIHELFPSLDSCIDKHPNADKCNQLPSIIRCIDEVMRNESEAMSKELLACGAAHKTRADAFLQELFNTAKAMAKNKPTPKACLVDCLFKVGSGDIASKHKQFMKLLGINLSEYEQSCGKKIPKEYKGHKCETDVWKVFCMYGSVVRNWVKAIEHASYFKLLEGFNLREVSALF